MSDGTPISPAGNAPADRSRWRGPLFFTLWTLFALMAAWWMIRSAGAERAQPELLFDSNPAAQTPVGEQVRRWLKIADLNFRGAYPWILLSPYVFWLASRFLFERGRLRVSIPVHLCACALFVAASQALTTHVVEKMNLVMYSSDREHNGGTQPGEPPLLRRRGTNLEEAVSIQSFDAGDGNRKTKVVVATDREVRSFDLPPLTNGMTVSGEISFATSLVTNLDPKAAALLDPVRHGLRAGLGATVGAGFSTVRSTWRYESRLFSQMLNVLAYGSLAGLAHAVHFYRRYRERERRAVLLEANLAKARLQMLQAQLQPHFLFNALNAVATLLRRDPRAAGEALTSFSELLRLALSQSDKQEVPLRDDLRFVERYVEIQQTRLGDRFRFEQDVEPEALDCLVPALLLQPLVENSLRHGIELSSSPGQVQITARKVAGRLRVTVEDNGVGLTAGGSGTTTTGIGLTNLRARLQALHGDDQQIQVVSGANGGVLVQVEFPFRVAEASGRSQVRPQA